ncbi:sodium channel protein Nach [Eurosta solidaginis]|uniref:sodium channel protein Nach n=1 Tax=Eurosta solidaginis TaxID=178769 RepID=UPI003531455B
MIRARNSIRNNKNQNIYNNKGTYQTNQYGSKNYAPPYAQSSEESPGGSTTTDSVTNSTAQLLLHEYEQNQLYTRRYGLTTLAQSTTMKGHGNVQPWRISIPSAPLQTHSTFVTPAMTNSRQKLPHFSKLQYSDTKLTQDLADMDPDARKVEHTTCHQNDRKLEVKALAHQHSRQQLMPTVKSQSQALGIIRRIRRPRQWLQRFSRVRAQPRVMPSGVSSKARKFILEFLQGSSIHGLTYLAKFGVSFVERMIWFAFICVAVFAIISLSKRTWERFQTSPMVISMDRNKLVWNTSFPSLTVCPHKRIDEMKVEEYMDANPKNFPSHEDRADFHIFIEHLARLTYENIETLPRNKTFGIPSAQYLDLLYDLKWNFEPEMSSGAAVQMYIYETLTEFGVCHSVNSLVARYNSYEYWKRNDWSVLDHGDRVTVHPLDGEIYAQIINLSTAYDVYFHGASDIPIISKQRYTFPETVYTTVELIALEIYTTEEARAFTIKQRKCRYQHEADDMLTMPIYSFGLCLSECRMFFALKVCGCVPHFYRNHLKNGRILRICDFDGLVCLEHIKREIISLKSNRYKIDCHCLSNCDDSNFFVQSYRSRDWFLGANLQWGIIDYPKMQLRRDVLFSFADVLVYIGGLVGFFLGCSALSFTEVIYYFTARLIKRMLSN